MNLSLRYAVLDARDKLMRLKGQHRPLPDGRLRGLCPDICPEKERYSRSAKNQLRFYEKTNMGEPNHRAVVKEYARSAADADVPLPHELRPSFVLVRAMNHLLCNVVDRIDSLGTSMDGWYADLEGKSLDFKSKARLILHKVDLFHSFMLLFHY